MESTCSNSTASLNVLSVCIVDRSEFLLTESCYWSPETGGFECKTNRTIFSPPCGTNLTEEYWLNQEWGSTTICPVVSAPVNGSVTFSNPLVTAGTVASFSCVFGSYLSDSRPLGCDGDGQWNGTVPTCIYRDCGDISNHLAYYNITTEYDVNSTVYGSQYSLSCIPGYTSYYSLPSDGTTKCQTGGNWSEPGLKCERKFLFKTFNLLQLFIISL